MDGRAQVRGGLRSNDGQFLESTPNRLAHGVAAPLGRRILLVLPPRAADLGAQPLLLPVENYLLPQVVRALGFIQLLLHLLQPHLEFSERPGIQERFQIALARSELFPPCCPKQNHPPG